jgi:hypothetical protein
MDLRRINLVTDFVYAEGGLAAMGSVTQAAACAVIGNPLAGRAEEDLQVMVSLGAELGEFLVRKALPALRRPVVAYGKAAIVGVSGDIEHAAAILHPLMGKPVRDAIGGGKAVIPSNVKIGCAGATIDIPLGHKDDAWSFDQMNTMTVMVPGAPRADEIVVILVLSDGGRPRPRVSKAGVSSPAGR